MRWSWLPRLLFILYCVEAGIFLVLAPWSAAWQGLLQGFPSGGLQGFLLSATGRGAVTGFGLIHLVWGAHDLESWLARRGSREATGS